jgi:hypothetical protein
VDHLNLHPLSNSLSGISLIERYPLLTRIAAK